MSPQVPLAFEGKPNNSQTLFEEVIICFVPTIHFEIATQLLYLSFIYCLEIYLDLLLNNYQMLTMY